jgi:ArsR family transcriptional regulator
VTLQAVDAHAENVAWPDAGRPGSSDPLLRQELAALTASICKALNDPTRLALLYALQRRPHTVKELCEAIQAPPSNSSSHLGVLRDRGLVEAQRQGNRVVYSLRHPKVIDAVDLLRQIMNEEIARQQALRAPMASPRRRDMAPDGPKPRALSNPPAAVLLIGGVTLSDKSTFDTNTYSDNNVVRRDGRPDSDTPGGVRPHLPPDAPRRAPSRRSTSSLAPPLPPLSRASVNGAVVAATS